MHIALFLHCQHLAFYAGRSGENHTFNWLWFLWHHLVACIISWSYISEVLSPFLQFNNLLLKEQHSHLHWNLQLLEVHFPNEYYSLQRIIYLERSHSWKKKQYYYRSYISEWPSLLAHTFTHCKEIFICQYTIVCDEIAPMQPYSLMKLIHWNISSYLISV